MQKIPDDPTSGATCPGYLVATSGIAYTLYIKLDNANDSIAQAIKGVPAVIPGGSSSPDGYKSFTIGSGTCAGSTYNYWINSQQ